MKSILTFIFLLYCWQARAQTRESVTVYFDLDRHELRETARLQIDSLLNARQQSLPVIEFELRGYCDSIGTDSYNDILSSRRATIIKNYLLQKNIAPQHILAAKGYGEKNPLNKNETDEQRQINRRVEIRIIMPRDKPLLQRLADSTVTAGTTLALKNINFFGNSHKYLPESYPVLVELLGAMKANPSLVIQIQGHICCHPDSSDGYNEQTNLYDLSEARARTIREFLIINRIAPERVSYKGFGHSKPLYPYPEKTDEERLQNRRVEILVIHK